MNSIVMHIRIRQGGTLLQRTDIIYYNGCNKYGYSIILTQPICNCTGCAWVETSNVINYHHLHLWDMSYKVKDQPAILSHLHPTPYHHTHRWTQHMPSVVRMPWKVFVSLNSPCMDIFNPPYLYYQVQFMKSSCTTKHLQESNGFKYAWCSKACSTIESIVQRNNISMTVHIIMCNIITWSRPTTLNIELHQFILENKVTTWEKNYQGSWLIHALQSLEHVHSVSTYN